MDQHAEAQADAPVQHAQEEHQHSKDRDRHVLADHAEYAPAQVDRGRNLVDAVFDEDDVRRFHGHLRAGSAHRDAHVGRRQSRCVVDAVADHRHPPPRRLDFLQCRYLLRRQEPRPYFTDADLSCDPVRGGCVVARQHHRALDAGAL